MHSIILIFCFLINCLVHSAPVVPSTLSSTIKNHLVIPRSINFNHTLLPQHRDRPLHLSPDNSNLDFLKKRMLDASSSSALISPANPPAFAGDMTYYNPGLGSCGWINSPNEFIVAMPLSLMNDQPNPNNAKWCGRKIYISHRSKIVQGTIVDACPACKIGDIDVSPKLFTFLAQLPEGRVKHVMWWFA